MQSSLVRQRAEEREERELAALATRSAQSRGRARPEEPDALRTCFQRDRDRIQYTNAFRRLMHKTQVFIAPEGDHYTTRLTHTLEVAQTARTIARALRLNEDLTEAISFGHDLGHTPFGHVGEETLGELLPGGFRHNAQSLRVVDVLERDGRGLNLTFEVRDGILKHSKGRGSLADAPYGSPATPEAQVQKLADAIAYISHDVGDAIRAGLLTEAEIPPEIRRTLGDTCSHRLDAIVRDVVATSQQAVATRVWDPDDPCIHMSPPVLAAASALREFLFTQVYEVRSRTPDADRAREVIRRLWRHFLAHPNQLPAPYLSRSEDGGDPLERRVADYIAGMTDHFAARLAGEVGA